MVSRRRIAGRIAGLVLLAAVMPAAACAAVTVVDDSGRAIRLERPAQRIVALAPHLTELLFAAGAGSAVVGAVAYSDYPPAAAAIPRIGDARALDLERIVALQPDLIVAWRSGSPRRQLARLRALGYSVYEDEPASLDAIAATIERLGILAGTGETARTQAARFRADLGRIRAQHAQAAPLRVFYQLGERPLVTVSSRHVIVDALHACGAVSVFAGHRDWLPRPSREAVLLADPDAIVVAAPPGATDPLAAWRRWTGLRAVAAGRLYTVDPDRLHRPTPRILPGVRALCRQLAEARAS